MTLRWISLFGVVAMTAFASPMVGAAARPALPNSCAVYVPEAAGRSGLSEDIVVRVMLAESGGNSRIVSAKGAIGCMQIMPATWTYLTARYNLGADPSDARMNMIGGAMYLAELASRYGWPGALSAYNAGPGRYQRYVQGGKPLPAETIAYTARIGGNSARLGGNSAARPVVAPAPRWQDARLFMTRPTSEGTAILPPAPTPSLGTADMQQRNSIFALSGRADGTNAGP